MKKDVVAVASRSFSKNQVLREELLALYPNTRFNDQGLSLAGSTLVEFLSGATKAITALEVVDESILKHLPDLEMISKYGVGLDSLDLAAFKKHGVQLGWSAGVNKRSVAELALGLILNCVRRTSFARDQVRKGEWSQIQGEELTGKTVGLLGCGNVGRELVRFLTPFECKVLAHDIRGEEPEYRAFYKDSGVEPVSQDELLACSDILSLHVPLTSQTKRLLTGDVLGRLKKGAWLINTARGGIIDEAALLAKLESGHLKGAAFDVFENEPPTDFNLINHPNFVATPHIGGSTVQSILAMGRSAIVNLEKPRPASEY